MRCRYYIFLATTLALAGCGKTQSYSLGGAYFIEGEKNYAPLIEPGGGSVNRRLVYRKDDQEVIICRSLGHLENADGSGSFEERVFGDNLVYIQEDQDRTHSYLKCLRVYSPQSGYHTVVDDLSGYVRIIPTDDGIKCYRASEANLNDDPNPKFFSADYLKKL